MSGFLSVSGIIKCHECKSSDTFTDTRMGEVVCRACGIVLGDRMIDDGAEWRTYNTDDAMHSSRADPNRIGATASPLLTADSGMNTMIEGGRDKKLTAKLQKVQGMAMGESTSESTLRDCFDSTRSIAERLRLGPTTKELACLLLRRLQDKSLFVHKTGPSGTAMCAAAVVAACRENGVPSAIKVVAAASSVKAGDLSKKYRHLTTSLGLRQRASGAEDLVPEVCTMLGLSGRVTEAAKHAAQTARVEDHVGGMMPSAVAAAAVLLVLSCSKRSVRRRDGAAPPPRKRKKSQKEMEDRKKSKEPEAAEIGSKEVAEAAKVAVPAMVKPFRALYNVRAELFTAEFLSTCLPKGQTLDKLPCVLC